MIDYRVLQRTAEFEIAGLRFRLELYLRQSDRRYLAQVYRYDVFRLPLLANQNCPKADEFADHELLLVDPMFGEIETEASSTEGALNYAINFMIKQLGSET
jgi:hypothetical protein